MKVSLSNFLRWGGRKDARDEAEPNGAFWGRKDRRRTPRRVLAGTGSVCWIDDAGQARRETTAFSDVSEDGSGLGAIARKELPVGPRYWAIAEDGVAFPIVVRHCVPCEEGYRLGAALSPEPQIVDGWGTAKLKWLGDEDKLIVAPASIRNADNGCIDVNAARNPPENELLLLEGAEFACLCRLRKSLAYGDRWLLEVEPVFDAAPAARAEPAA